MTKNLVFWSHLFYSNRITCIYVMSGKKVVLILWAHFPLILSAWIIREAQHECRIVSVGSIPHLFVRFLEGLSATSLSGSSSSNRKWDVGAIGGHAQPPRWHSSKPRSRLCRLWLDLRRLSYRGLVWIPINWTRQNLYHRGHGNNESNGRALAIHGQCVTHFLKWSCLHRIASLWVTTR